MVADTLVRPRTRGDPARLQRRRLFADAASPARLDGRGLAEELADISGDVLRVCRDRRTFPGSSVHVTPAMTGYEFQVSTRTVKYCFAVTVLVARATDPSFRACDMPASHTSLTLDRLGPVRLARRMVSGPANPLVVQVVVSLAPNERALRELLVVLLLTVPPVVAGALGGGYWLARKALAPVDRMAATAKRLLRPQGSIGGAHAQIRAMSWADWRIRLTT